MSRYRLIPEPRGTMAHGPGHARNKYGLSLYHETNSLRGVRKYAALGYDWIDLDLRELLDGEFVGAHSDDTMGKEHFTGPRVPRRVLSRLRWRAVRLLKRKDGYRIQKFERLCVEAARRGIGVAIDLKTPLSEADADRLVAMLNRTGVLAYAKCDGTKPALVKSLDRLRARGMWTRFNGDDEFREPR